MEGIPAFMLCAEKLNNLAPARQCAVGDHSRKPSIEAVGHHVRKGPFDVNEVPTNAPKQDRRAKVLVLEDNEAIIKQV